MEIVIENKIHIYLKNKQNENKVIYNLNYTLYLKSEIVCVKEKNIIHSYYYYNCKRSMLYWKFLKVHTKRESS